jgi:uroporphyrinogen III methyltransferase/synthase
VRVIVTRPREQAGPLVERLEALGLDVLACPLIEVERTSDEPIDASGYEWLVVTSPNGADELARRLVPPWPKVAAVGPGTAERLREHGVEPDFVPRVSSQEGLIAEFSRPAGRVLLAAAEGARRRAIDALAADFLPLYRTRLLVPETPPEGDLVVLASGSAVRAFARLGLRVPAVTIGPQTSRVAERLGLRVAAEAETHDLDGLVAAVARVASAPS